MTAVCPCCGFDIEAEETVTFGRLAFDPRIGVRLGDDRLKMAPQCHWLLGALMRSAGTYLSRPALEDRFDWAGRSRNTLDVHLSKIRSALRDAGLPVLLETQRDIGVRFDPRPLLRDDQKAAA